MATDAVPAQAPSGSMIQTWWFSFLARTGLVLLAFWALWFAQDRYGAFRVRLSPFFTYNNMLWLLSVAATVVAGLLFGLAAWLPFTRIRYPEPTLARRCGAGAGRALLVDLLEPTRKSNRLALAGFAGVALASGFRAKDQALGILER